MVDQTSQQQSSEGQVPVMEVDTQSESTQYYIPTSVEKKRVVMMYLLLGIMIMTNKPTMTEFEYFHLKQSTGWWILFLALIVVSAVVLMLPVVKYLGLLPMIVIIGVWFWFSSQAWKGKYGKTKQDTPLSLFAGIGGWILDLFEVKTDVLAPQENIQSTSQQMQEPQQLQSQQPVEPQQNQSTQMPQGSVGQPGVSQNDNNIQQ